MIYNISNEKQFEEFLNECKDTELYDPRVISKIATQLIMQHEMNYAMDSSDWMDTNFALSNKEFNVVIIMGDASCQECKDYFGDLITELDMFEFMDEIEDIEGNIVAYQATYIISDDGAGIVVFASSDNEFYTEMYNKYKSNLCNY